MRTRQLSCFLCTSFWFSILEGTRKSTVPSIPAMIASRPGLPSKRERARTHPHVSRHLVLLRRYPACLWSWGQSNASPSLSHRMRWATDVIAPLLFACTPRHAMCFSGGKQRLPPAAPSVGTSWHPRHRAGRRQCSGRSWSSAAASTRQRRRLSSALQRAHEEHGEQLGHGVMMTTTTTTASSSEGDANTKPTQYTINVGVHPDVAEIAVKHATQLPRFLDNYPISSHTRDAYSLAVEFVQNFHHESARNSDNEVMHCKQCEQDDQDAKAGEDVSCAQHQQQPHRQQHRPLPVLLDSGCGTGRSSVLLARAYPHLPVIGVDRSAARLSKGGGGRHGRHTDGSRRPAQAQAEQRGDDEGQGDDRDVDDGSAPVAQRYGHHVGDRRDPFPRNLLLLRADLVDLWILASRSNAWQVQEHSILYPNPYPKRSQLRSRWHGHSIFPVLLSLGGRITLRSNWKTYLDEVCLAVLAINDEAERSKGKPNMGAVQQREGGRGGEPEPVVHENGGADVLPVMEVPDSVAAAAASYVFSAKAGPSIFAPTVPAATNFEAKYVAVGEPVYELLLEPRLPQ